MPQQQLPVAFDDQDLQLFGLADQNSTGNFNPNEFVSFSGQPTFIGQQNNQPQYNPVDHTGYQVPVWSNTEQPYNPDVDYSRHEFVNNSLATQVPVINHQNQQQYRWSLPNHNSGYSGPVDHNSGPPIYNSGPPNYNTGSVDYNAIPSNHGTGSLNYNRGLHTHDTVPSNYFTGQLNHDTESSNFFARPVQYNTTQLGHNTVPFNHNNISLNHNAIPLNFNTRPVTMGLGADTLSGSELRHMEP